MNVFWMAIGVLAGTVGVLTGLGAFQFRRGRAGRLGPGPVAAPAVRDGLFAEAAAEFERTGGELPAAFRFDGDRGLFTPVDAEPSPSTASPSPSTASPSLRPAAAVGRGTSSGRRADAGRPRGARADTAADRGEAVHAVPPADSERATRPPDRAIGSSTRPAAPGVADGPPAVADSGSAAPVAVPESSRHAVSPPVSPDVSRAPGREGAAWLPRTHGRRRLLVIAVTGASAVAGLVVAGPVGMLAAVYGRLAVRGLLRRDATRAEARARTRTLDMLCTLAADLRAGLPRTDPPVLPDPRIGRLTTAAWRLAERTGAPLADLVERIESDTRAMARGQATAAAEAAGARATAWLLAGLPVGGLVLGAFMGVDPLQVLLHTPTGAACATGAVILQSAGLAWANRLATSGGPQ